MTGDLISREALMQFPIRRDHYDRENGSSDFVNGIETVLEYAENIPSIDAVPVVRCNMCRYYETDTGYCAYHDGGMHWDGFCSCGAKMDEEGET